MLTKKVYLAPAFTIISVTPSEQFLAGSVTPTQIEPKDSDVTVKSLDNGFATETGGVKELHFD